MGKIIAVGSGCGGVGKSTVALSVAAGASERGLRTILFDVSGSARSCDLMLGIESLVVLDMLDVIKQQTSIASALYPIPERKNLSFACASLYDGEDASAFSGILLALRAMCDLLVIDLPTGPLAVDQSLFDERDALLLLTRPDDVSVRACERMLSYLAASALNRHLVITRINSFRVKKKAQYSQQQVEMILDMPSSACIPENDALQMRSERGKTPFDTDIRLRIELNKLLGILL